MTWKELEAGILEGLGIRQREWVQSVVNLESDNDILSKSREELIRMFPEVKKDGRLALNDKACMLTFVWQAWLRIKSGEAEPLEGNIRSFWYREVEPFYVEKDLLDSDLIEPAKGMSLLAALTELDPEAFDGLLEEGDETETGVAMVYLVRKHPELAARVSHAAREGYICNLISDSLDAFVLEGIFRFQDEFKFADPRGDWRTIGERRPRIVLFTEKQGLWWLCEYAAAKYGITAIASQGEPGLLAMEYFYDALKKKGVASVEVGALTDYDPWGHHIAEEFAGKLCEQIFFGAGKVKMKVLNGTQDDLKTLFDPAELERGKRDLRKYSRFKQSQVEAWFQKTNGIGGERFGIHVDLARKDRLKAAVDRWVKSVEK